ncbi:Peroxisomal ATPase PEX6 [Dirofilaria immitis]
MSLRCSPCLRFRLLLNKICLNFVIFRSFCSICVSWGDFALCFDIIEVLTILVRTNFSKDIQLRKSI